MSTPEVRPVPDPRAALLEELRRRLGEAEQLIARAARIEAGVFASAYAWISATVAGQHARTIGEAIEQLAGHVGHSTKAVESWCYCGKLMADRHLPPAEVDAAAVRVVYNSARKLPKAALTRAVAMVREGRPLKEIRLHVSRHTEYTEADAKRAASQASNAGKSTKKTVQSIAQLLVAVARRVYGTDDVIVSVRVNDRRVLLEGRRSPADQDGGGA